MATVELYDPYPHQKAVHDAISQHLRLFGTEEFQKNFVIRAPRQTGKSMMVANELVRFSLSLYGSTNTYLSTTIKLSLKMYDEIVNMLNPTGYVKKSNRTDRMIRLTNGSCMQFYSAQQGADNLRGYTATALKVDDEVAFINDDIFTVISPWVDVHKALTLSISSPNFERGYFYELWKRGQDPSDTKVVRFDFTDYDLTMLRSEQRLEELRKTTPAQKFRSEYLGLFRKMDGSVFGQFESQVMQHKAAMDDRLHWGIDFSAGRKKDYTVLTAFNGSREQCFLWYDNDMTPTKQVRFIIDTLNRYRDKTVAIFVEDNGIGAIYRDLLISEVSNIRPFTTTNESKRKLVESFQVAIQNKVVWLIDDVEQNNQLSLFEASKTKTGAVSYAAPAKEHDDIVMALLMAHEAFERRQSPSYQLI